MTDLQRRVFRIAAAAFLIIILFSGILAYRYYGELRRELLGIVSAKATAIAGQPIEVNDIFFSLPARITLHEITVKNPDGFLPGKLLEAKKISADLDIRELLRRRVFFRSISVSSPVLHIARDKDGRFNISDKLLSPGESALKYRIDEFLVKSGEFRFGVDPKAHVLDINLTLRGLSSEPSTKTSLKGTASFSGNRIALEGWGYLKDKPKNFSISLRADNVSLEPLQQLVGNYFTLGKTGMDIELHAKGDSEKGFSVRTEALIKKGRYGFFRNAAPDIHVAADVFYSIPESSIRLRNAIIQAGGISSVHMHGIVNDLLHTPSYKMEAKIDELDLSAFRFPEGLSSEGILSSDSIIIRGAGKALPNISGTVKLSGGAVKSPESEISGIHATATFSGSKDFAVHADASGEVRSAGNIKFTEPAALRLSIHGEGRIDNLSLATSLVLSRVRFNFTNGKTSSLESVSLDAAGVLHKSSFSGQASLSARGIHYEEKSFDYLTGSLTADYRNSAVLIRDLKLAMPDLHLSAEEVDLDISRKARTVMKTGKFHVAVPSKEAAISGLGMNIGFDTGEKRMSGDFGFSVEKLSFMKVETGKTSGNGKFDGRSFSVTIPSAEYAGGTISLEAEGRTAKELFPLRIALSARNIDLGIINEHVNNVMKLPYGISGKLKQASFSGVVESMESLRGTVSVNGEKVSLLHKGLDRLMLQNGIFDAHAVFHGKDLEIETSASAGRTSVKISGTVREFMKKERSLSVRAVLPRMKVADIRQTFWGIFPDSLLYAGLEGFVSADLSADIGTERLKVNGKLACEDVMLAGEYGEFEAGPINGVLPLSYVKNGRGKSKVTIPSFEVSEFSDLMKYYSDLRLDNTYHRITVGAFSYGFKLFENITIDVKQQGDLLNIGRVSANIFGGNLFGSAVVDIAEKVSYRAGFLLRGLSMTSLTEEIAPIRGYISGKVDGIAALRGTGKGISSVLGRADFWTYSTDREKTVISREFLQKVGGPSMKSYLRDRRFDKGLMGVYLRDGFVIFRELEISNRNFFGVRDLSIKVAPLNNRISFDNLLWSLTEAAQRAKKDDR